LRDFLKNFDWHIYGLSIDDFDHTKSTISNIIDDRRSTIEIKVANLTERGIDSEAEADVRYYSEIEHQNLWQFGIWRLQGIFEGILKQDFGIESRGLNNILKDAIEKGIGISETERIDLLEWGKLRNALSHFPPEKYRPSPLSESDFDEYLELVKNIIIRIKS
jgi:hypothetical protein